MVSCSTKGQGEPICLMILHAGIGEAATTTAADALRIALHFVHQTGSQSTLHHVLCHDGCPADRTAYNINVSIRLTIPYADM